MKRRLAILASGNGSNFEAIAAAAADGEIDAEVVLCVCDKAGAGVLQRAERYQIPTFVFDPHGSTKEEFEGRIVERLDAAKVDLVCLAGYMRIVGEVLLAAYGGRIVNIHPALLPAFKGAHAIRDSFEAGVKVFGVTIHYVDQTLDGGRIIAQSAFPYEGDDIEALEAMIHRTEHKLYVDTIKKLIEK